MLALCSACRAFYEKEKREHCPHCGKPHVFCECNLDCYRYFHLLPYHPHDSDSIARKLVLCAKTHASRSLLRFEAKELSALLQVRGILHDRYVITYVPRSRHSRMEYGFDQAELLAKALAKELDFAFASFFKHKGNAKQKTLTALERSSNAAASYVLDGDHAFYARGKRIILLDDVVTTGSSMKSCANLLRRAGAVEVVLLSLARTVVSSE